MWDFMRYMYNSGFGAPTFSSILASASVSPPGNLQECSASSFTPSSAKSGTHCRSSLRSLSLALWARNSYIIDRG